MTTCLYTKKSVTPYRTTWETTCGNSVSCPVPEEVGMCFAPLPNEYGKYCSYCGKLIEVEGETTTVKPTTTFPPSPKLLELKTRPCTLEEVQAALVQLIELHNKFCDETNTTLRNKQDRPFKTSL